jgi:two-component system alkaline phosphatase synthesis response regulator PhoP
MNKKILVADDEAHILHVVSMKLTNAGFDVITAVDGEEALELSKSDKPDLVITDYQMPIMTGVEFCKAMRTCEQTKDIPAIMLTARGFDIEPEEMASAGISAVLAKPFSPREILEKVNELLACGQATNAPANSIVAEAPKCDESHLGFGNHSTK